MKTCLKPIVVAVILLAVVRPAFATFPGSNGHIAYLGFIGEFPNAHAAIFVTGLGPLITRTSTDEGDLYPVWSPDGSQLAVVHRNGPLNRDSIRIIRRDGTGERELVGSEVFGVPGRGYLRYPAWSADGRSISFVRLDFTFGEYSIYTINTDGSRLTRIIGPDLQPDQPEWSSQGDLLFLCNVPGVGSFPVRGICVRSGGRLSQLRIDSPDPIAPGTVNVLNTTRVSSASWSPDGQTILLTAGYVTRNNGHQVGRSEVLMVNKDGTGLREITHSPDACPNLTNPSQGSSANMGYLYAALSPDGKSIIAVGSKIVVASTHDGFCDFRPESYGLWTLDARGGAPGLLTTSNASNWASWQPIPQSLTFDISDGHGNPLKGMNVELRRADHTVLDDQPINTTGGTYVFEDALAPGVYILRATLVDRCLDPCVAAFDIRYGPGPDEPVWFEWRVTVTSNQNQSYGLAFDQLDSELIAYNIPADAAPRLDDIADIYFRVRQYVDWVKTHITPDTSPTVHYYTFATSDPLTGDPVDPKTAYYTESRIVFGVLESEYETRDGVSDPGHDNDAPLNGEWHEFTHHLHRTRISNNLCTDTVDHHAGYNNPDTCASLVEGFADFLPTLAAQEILGGGSFYNGSDLQLWWKAWDSNKEETAVAALFWDLVVRNGNTETSAVIRNGQAQPFFVRYTNSLPTMSIVQLWNQLTTAHPVTVFDLRRSFGDPELTIDLEGDGVVDVAPIDIPFLMHGFYPVDTEQQRLGPNAPTYYDVAYAQRANPGARRDAAIGGTGHYAYDDTPPRPLIPRNKRMPQPHANVSLTVLDALGAPLDGATVNLTISYPGGQSRSSERLGRGSGALVHLELPSYFNYPLAPGAPLPPCDPAHDMRVIVTLSVEKDGQVSTETPSFDNCTYLHAVAAATGPAALSFTVRVPVTGGDIFPPITTAALSPQPNAAGWNNQNVAVTLAAIDNGGSGVKQTAFSTSGAQTTSTTVVPGAAATLVVSREGQTTVTFFATDNAGNTETPNQSVVSIDRTAPSITCGAADAQWHGGDISIACRASDGLSGLPNPSDASFALTTAVPVGTETANASTGSHSVCDVADNCATAGPIGSNRIDKQAPAISISAPMSGTYVLNQAVAASYTCADGGSGVASCAGSVANGASIETALVGSNTFTVNAADKVGNVAAPQSVTYTVSYNVCVLYDQTRSVKRGSTIPLKLQLCDANNADVSSASVVVHATGLMQTGSTASEVIQDSGNANPDDNFRYDRSLGPTGGYIYNLSTKSLVPGIYVVSFTAGTDPTAHTAMFQVR